MNDAAVQEESPCIANPLHPSGVCHASGQRTHIVVGWAAGVIRPEIEGVAANEHVKAGKVRPTCGIHRDHVHVAPTGEDGEIEIELQAAGRGIDAHQRRDVHIARRVAIGVEDPAIALGRGRARRIGRGAVLDDQIGARPVSVDFPARRSVSAITILEDGVGMCVQGQQAQNRDQRDRGPDALFVGGILHGYS